MANIRDAAANIAEKITKQLLKEEKATRQNTRSKKENNETIEQSVRKMNKLNQAMFKLLGVQKKVNKSTLFSVRNQRLLNDSTSSLTVSLATFRSRLLVASFGLNLLQRSTNTLVGEYASYEAAQKRVISVLKSTSNASAQTLTGLSELASEIQNATGISDTFTLTSSALLATFTQISGETFPEAQMAIIDMTAAMNAGKVTQEGLKSSTIQVGKALNDPIKGLNALSRVGVKFTDQQKKQIKSFVNLNQVAKAQEIIIKELNKEFGGTASADTYEKSIRSLQSAVGDLQKEIGVGLLPRMKGLVEWVTKMTKATKPSDIYQFATAIGISAAAIKTYQAWLSLTVIATEKAITRTAALRVALAGMSTTGIIPLIIGGAGLL